MSRANFGESGIRANESLGDLMDVLVVKLSCETHDRPLDRLYCDCAILISRGSSVIFLFRLTLPQGMVILCCILSNDIREAEIYVLLQEVIGRWGIC